MPLHVDLSLIDLMLNLSDDSYSKEYLHGYVSGMLDSHVNPYDCNAGSLASADWIRGYSEANANEEWIH